VTLSTRSFRANADGEGTITVPPVRLAAFDGATTAKNRGNTFSAGDRLPPDMEFVEGSIAFSGADPNERVTAYFDF
jgi:hypothetical protein